MDYETASNNQNEQRKRNAAASNRFHQSTSAHPKFEEEGETLPNILLPPYLDPLEVVPTTSGSSPCTSPSTTKLGTKPEERRKPKSSRCDDIQCHRYVSN